MLPVLGPGFSSTSPDKMRRITHDIISDRQSNSIRPHSYPPHVIEVCDIRQLNNPILTLHCIVSIITRDRERESESTHITQI